MTSAYGPNRPLGGGRVYGEQPYGNAKATPDIAIDLGLDLVLIEVRSGYLREETRVSGDIARFRDDLERVLFSKIRQLGDRIADIVAGSAKIPGVDISIVERIWPIVVTATITQTEALHDWIDQELTSPYRHSRVQRLLVLEHEDLEVLMGMVERSEVSLPAMLRRRQEGVYSRLEFVRWPNEDPMSPGALRPTSSERSWAAATGTVHSVLQLPGYQNPSN